MIAGLDPVRKLWSRLGSNSIGVAAAFAIRALSALLSFGLSWALAQLYGADGLGVYSVAVTTAVFASYLALLGQDYVILRTVSGDIKVGDLGSAANVVLTSVLVASAAAIVAAVVIGLYDVLIYSAELPVSQRVLLVVSPAVIALALMRTGSSALRATGSMIVPQLLEGMINPILILAGVLILWQVQGLPSLQLLTGMYVFATFVGAAIAWIAYRRRTRAWPRAHVTAPAALLLAGTPMLISAVSNAAAEWSAIFSTIHFAGAEAAGQLRVALQIMLAVTLLTASFDTILGPPIAAAWRIGDHDGLRRMYRKATIGMSLAAAPIIAAELFAPVQLMRLFGEDFMGGATALRILAIGQLFTIAGGPIGTVLIMSRQDRWLVAYSLMSVVLVAVLCLTLVPAYGVLGGAAVIAGNMIFRRTAGQLILRYVVGLKLSIWRRG